MDINKNELEKLVSDITQQAVSALNTLTDEINANLGQKPLIARMIDHTLLKPDASAVEIAQLCEEASQYRFASVCVNPTNVRQCAELLQDVEDVAVCTVVGFPLGATTPEVKAYETLQVVADGATEVDMVINVGAIKNKNWPLVQADVRRVVQAAHAGGAICKVILENALLTDEEIVTACQICQKAGADFVKTSTGFGPGGATVEDVALMRQTVGPEMGVKAAGGVRTYEDAQQMIEAGATRIGASAGIRIVEEAQGQASTEETPPADY